MEEIFIHQVKASENGIKIWLVIQQRISKLASRKKNRSYWSLCWTTYFCRRFWGVFVWIALEEKGNQSLRNHRSDWWKQALFSRELWGSTLFHFPIQRPRKPKKLRPKMESAMGFYWSQKDWPEISSGDYYYGEENPNMNLINYLENYLKKESRKNSVY